MAFPLLFYAGTESFPLFCPIPAAAKAVIASIPLFFFFFMLGGLG